MATDQKKKVVVVGGGLSGLALGISLADNGYEVHILEAKNRLGGRASNTYDRKMDDPVPIGPHVFVTAYKYFRHFLEKIDARSAISWEKKIFLEVVYKGKHFQFRLNKIPKPFYMLPWLITYPFISMADKISNIPLTISMITKSRRGIEKLDSENAYAFLRRMGVTKNAIDKFWRFFALSLLNIPLEDCSAAEFFLLMQLWSKIDHHEFGFVKVGLGDLYVDKAREYIENRGGKIHLSSPVKKISMNGGEISHLIVDHNSMSKKFTADTFVMALDPVTLRELLPHEVRFSDYFRNLDRFEGVPYISVNLWFDKKITDKKFWAMLHDKDTADYLNTDFYDQSNIYETRKNHSLITSNIIFSKAYEGMTDGDIIKKTVEELEEAFPAAKDATVVHSHIHRIPYVVYAPYPGMRCHKLSYTTPVPNMYLAGDWLLKDFVQCMDAAVHSGYACAEEILRAGGINKTIYTK